MSPKMFTALRLLKDLLNANGGEDGCLKGHYASGKYHQGTRLKPLPNISQLV